MGKVLVTSKVNDTGPGTGEVHWGQLVGEVAFQVVIEKLAGVVVVKSQQRVGLRKEIEETLTELGKPMLYDRNEE